MNTGDVGLLGEDSPVFAIPKTRQEAEERLVALRAETLLLQRQLEEWNAAPIETVLARGGAATQELRRKVAHEYGQKSGEIGFLRRWMKDQLTFSRARAPAAPPTLHQALLVRVSTMFNDLLRQGVVLTEDQRLLMAEVHDAIESRDDLLEAARACRFGSPEQFFEVGRVIVQVTRSAMDLAALSEAWSDLTVRQGDAERDQYKHHVTVAYTEVLATLGEYHEAFKVTKDLNAGSSELPYALLRIAEHARSEELLQRLRELGKRLLPGKREWFFLRLYEVSGETQDAEMATPDPGKARFLGVNSGRHRAELVRALAKHGDVTMARVSYNTITTAEDRLFALIALAEFSGDRQDVESLLTFVRNYPPARMHTMQLLVPVLVQHGHAAEAEAMLLAMKSWHLRCLGFSQLAVLTVPEKGRFFLDKAESLVPQDTKMGGEFASAALLHLAYAFAKHGRFPTAQSTVECIPQALFRCRALLAIRQVMRGRPVPPSLLASHH